MPKTATPRLEASLRVAAASLARYDKAEKTAKRNKEKARTRFFTLATKHISKNRKLATQTVEFYESNHGETVHDHVAKHYQQWELVGFNQKERDKDGTLWSVTLRERPEMQKFTFVHPETGIKVGRTFEERGAYFDTEGLLADHPNLAALVLTKRQTFTYLPGEWDGEGELSYTYELDEKATEAVIEEMPEALAVIQKYAVPGKINAKLTPITKATEKDLG